MVAPLAVRPERRPGVAATPVAPRERRPGTAAVRRVLPVVARARLLGLVVTPVAQALRLELVATRAVPLAQPEQQRVTAAAPVARPAMPALAVELAERLATVASVAQATPAAPARPA